MPDSGKLAKLKLLFKQGSRMDPSNYKPILLLPLVSKILEKIVHDQAIDYLSQFYILSKYQRGFWTIHSTDLRLSYLNDNILKGCDNRLLTEMILVDLQKAFDTTGDNIIIEKLKAILFCGHSVNSFHSYLTNRKFLVIIENEYSSISKIGVPQRSIVGPLLF